MHPLAFAALAGLCWSVGGFFEKQGLRLAGLPPVAGIAVRTAVALLVLGVAAAPHLPALKQAGAKPLLYLVLGGGVVAGSAGMLCFYAALASGEIGRVMAVAFGLTPLAGFALGALLHGDPVTPLRLFGVAAVSLGVVCVTWK